MFPSYDGFWAAVLPIRDKAPFAAMTDIVLSVLMLAALALFAGAFVLWRRTGQTKQPALMVVLAVIALVNIAIWTLPTASGEAPIDQLEAAGEG